MIDNLPEVEATVTFVYSPENYMDLLDGESTLEEWLELCEDMATEDFNDGRYHKPNLDYPTSYPTAIDTIPLF